jgi:hypothetical protein
MNPINPLRPSSLEDMVGPVESSPAYGNYGPSSSYTPYRWEMPWIEIPQSSGTRFDELRPEPPPLPRYEDCLMTSDLFARSMRCLDR